MSRLGRYFVPDQPLHLIQRGNNRGAIFFHDDDRVVYLQWLGEAAEEYGCALHAYVLMDNHVHLLATPADAQSIPRMLQSLGRRYVRRINDAYGRTGTLWEGRYRAAPIDSEAWFFICCRYIELNPVRARLVKHPRLWRWSSYRASAEGKPDALLTPHALYRALARSRADRAKAYRALFREKPAEESLDALRIATNGGWALGGERFRREIAKAAGRRATPLPRGRSKKKRRRKVKAI
ncbi:MAG TPA: transposase [Rhizomicrobium sp.]